MWLFVQVNAQAQCDPCVYQYSAVLADNNLLPYCDNVDLDVSVYNGLNPCPLNVRIEISVGTLTDNGFSELANFKLASNDADFIDEDTWAEGNSYYYRRFNFEAEVPAFDLNFLQQFQFDFTADNNNAPAGTYRLHILVYPLPIETCDPGGWPAPEVFDLQLVPDDLTHRKISGKVSDLIASNDLNANSCTQPAGNDRIIQGELEIDQDFCFLGVSTDPISIYLLPGARIEVKPGKTLTLNHVNIFTCDQLAEGIIVETGGKLIAQYVNFNDMRFAVNAQSASSLDIRNCNFTNNYVGLHLDMTGAAAGQEQVSFLGFSGNTFSTAPGQALKAAYPGMPEAIEERGYCGIFLKNYRDFNVFGANSFERLANGIVATNTNLNVGNLTFSDMRHSGVVNAYPREGFGIHLSARNNSSWANIGLPWAPMNFDDCKTAVFAERYAGKVEHCTMTGVDLGVDWQKSPTRDVRIRNNDITANRYGVRAFLNEPTHNASNIKDNEVTIEGQGDELEPVTGIQLNEVTGGNIGNGWKIDTNSVTLKNGGWGIAYRNGNFGNIRGNIVLNEDPGAGNFNGLKIEGVANSALSANNIDGGGASGISNCILSSAGWANTIQCNCLNNSDIGIQFLDEADFTDAVRGNHFFTHCYGLQIGAPGIDTAYSAYIGKQEYQGNLWELDTNSMLCTYGGINYANPEESTFIVNGVANQQCNPPVTPVSLWFFSLTKQDNYNGCGACSAPGTPPRVVETGAPTGIDEAIVQDSLPTDLLNWKGRYRLYRKILRWPVMENQSSYAGFKSAHSNQSTGQLAYIAEQRSGLFALTPTQQSSINAQSGAFLQHMIALRTLDSLRLTGIPVNENSYADLVTQRNTAATQLEALYFSIDTTRRNQIQTLASLNAAVTTSLACDANHKTVNAIVFQLLLSDTLAAGDLAVLEAIAGQCPLEGGDAVYEARAIVMQLTGADFNDLDICASANRSIVRTEKKAEAKTVLYPNPTTGLVRWAESAADLAQVEVYDPLGRLLLKRLTTDPYIDLRPLPDGRYWIRLYSPAGGSTVQQVILVKE